MYFQESMAESSTKTRAYAKRGRSHSSEYHNVFNDCFKCGQNDHFIRVFPKTRHINGKQGNKTQSSSISSQDRVI